MAEMVNSKRVKFHKGKQRAFINKCLVELKLTNSRLAKILNVNPRTLTDWKREKFTMSFGAIKFLSKKLGEPIPTKIKIKKPFWYVSSGSSAGGIAVYKKYGYIGGDPEYRKKRWFLWWEREGKFKPHPIINVTKPIKRPRKSEKLAEFVGIVMGDGGITKNQLTITLHRRDDEKYGKYVVKLIKKLFGVSPSKYHYPKDSVNDFVVSRTELIKFCTEKLGLKIGNKIKQQIDIPTWIKKNKKFRIACLRGLVDTDGCLVIHKYKVKEKQYCYKKLDFCSASLPLVSSVMQILKNYGFRPRLSRNHRNIWLDNQKEVARYLAMVGSNNPKHLRRYRE